MKTGFMFLVAAMFITFSAAASELEKEYGKKLTLTKTTSIADILKAPEQYDGKRVLVEGTISDVCKMMGCWIMIKDKTSGQEIQFKVEDGVIEFPTEESGKMVRAEGTVEVKTVSVEDQIKQGEHHAEEMGEEFDPASVTGPKVRIRLLGEGAIVQ